MPDWGYGATGLGTLLMHIAHVARKLRASQRSGRRQGRTCVFHYGSYYGTSGGGGHQGRRRLLP